MSIGDISLTASTRANLTALQNTAKLLGTTQSHLSTGKKVNSALDNATSYFASQGFLNSANDLAGLKDSMATALQTIKAASDAITSIKNIVTQLQGVANSAAQTNDTTQRANYATQYDDLMTQLDNLANDATFNGTNLVNSVVSELKVQFNASNTTNLTVQGSDLRSQGLGIGNAQNGFEVGSLAKQVSGTFTVGADTSLAIGTTVYTGEVNDITLATGTVVLNAQTARIESNSTDYATGTHVAEGTANNAAMQATRTAAVTTAAFTQVSVTNSGGAITVGNIDEITVDGQFSVIGGGTNLATNFTNAGVLTAADTSTVISVAGGQTIKFYVHDSDGHSDTYILRNDTTTAKTFALGAGFTATMGASNNTATANLNSTSVGADATYMANLELANVGTLNGNELIDIGSTIPQGTTFTGQTTSDGTGETAGTTTTGSATVYDVTGATVTNITKTDIVATLSSNAGTSAHTYNSGSSGLHMALDDVRQATASTTTTIVGESLTIAQNQLTAALATLRTAGSSLGNNNTLVQTRQDFTSSMISTLQTASDNLILADTNEEGANMQALQAQNQLGIVSLSISGQLAQSILKLF